MALPQERQTQGRDDLGVPANTNVRPQTKPKLVVDNTPIISPPEKKNRQPSKKTAPQQPQKPFNVQVTRKQEQAPTDARYQTIDQRRQSESTKETTSERLRTPSDSSRENRLKNRLQNNVVEWKRQRRVTRFQKNKSWLTALAKEQGSIKGVAKKAKVIRATWIAASICFTLYTYQLIFWLISLIGAAFFAPDELTEALDLAWWQKVGLSLGFISFETVTGMSGEQLFYLGYIVFIFIAFIQFLITIGVYTFHRVNPFKGKGLTTFIIALVFSLIPFLQVVPLIFWWVYVVLKEHK